MAPAWAALERGGPLPAEFTDATALLARILGGRPVTFSLVSLRPRGRDLADPLRAALDSPVNPVAMALPALAAAVEPDPLQAALEALWAAVTAYAGRRAEFLAEVRRAFRSSTGMISRHDCVHSIGPLIREMYRQNGRGACAEVL